MKLRLRWLVVLFTWFAGILISQDIVAQDDFPIQPERTSASLIRSVRLFPNPAIDYVHIRIEQANIQNVKLSLHNLIGNKMDVESEIIDEHEMRIRVKDLSIGYYLITVSDIESNLNGTFKFVKK